METWHIKHEIKNRWKNLWKTILHSKLNANLHINTSWKWEKTHFIFLFFPKNQKAFKIQIKNQFKMFYVFLFLKNSWKSRWNLQRIWVQCGRIKNWKWGKHKCILAFLLYFSFHFIIFYLNSFLINSYKHKCSRFLAFFCRCLH